MKIRFLKAFNGDCIHLSFQDKNILIDGGMPSTFSGKGKRGKTDFGELKKLIDQIKSKNEYVDLLILSHVDQDHIGGILKWFSNDDKAHELIKKVWFNSGRLISELFNQKEIEENLLIIKSNKNRNTSTGEGIIFENYIEKHEIWDRKIIRDKETIKSLGLEFRILSPTESKLEKLLVKWEKEHPDNLNTAKTENDYSLSLKTLIASDKFKEDRAIHNGSSISFILTYNNKNLLFLGDAHPTNVINSLKHFGYSKENKLECEFLKLSHHGSKSNNNKDLLEMLNTNTFVVSTNGKNHSHPDKQMLSRIINLFEDAEILFNYPDLIEQIFSEKDYIDFPKFKPSDMLNNTIIIANE